MSLPPSSGPNELNLSSYKKRIYNVKQKNITETQNTNSIFARMSSSNSQIKQIRSLDSLLSSKVKSKGNEFKINNENFPALPETSRSDQLNSNNFVFEESQLLKPEFLLTFGLKTEVSRETTMQSFKNKKINEINPQEGPSNSNHIINADIPKTRIQTSDGKVTNIPESVIKDQFGIIGEMMGLKLSAEKPSLTELTIGNDLCSLGLHLNSPENIYSSFAGPFACSPLGSHQLEYNVPSEYRFKNKNMKLPDIYSSMSKYKEDLLFYLFYTFFGENIQLAAAAELRTRGWCYHTSYYVWIFPAPGKKTLSKQKKYEEGTFYVFDFSTWRKIKKHLKVVFSDLEDYKLWQKNQTSHSSTK